MSQLEIKPDAELDKQFRFEMLLAEISTFFINLPADRIDSEIEVAQRRVCELLDLDRSSLFQVLEEESYSWPGNVRELRNLIEHAMILSKGKTLEVQVPKRADLETQAIGKLVDVERRHISAVLEKTGWRIAGHGGAAEVLGLKRTTLQAKIKKLGIQRSNKPMPN